MPVATADATIHAYFGNFREAAIIGDRMGIRIGQSDQYAFNEDVLTIRATARYDINVHEPGTASAVGAYVALKSAS
jgi:HK97 family phage major capsid protein